MRTRGRTWLAVGCAAAATACIVAACYPPTSVEVTISTDSPCRPEANAPRTEIYVGESLATAEDVGGTKACTPSPTAPKLNEIGSIVVVPKGARDAVVTVHVVMTTDGEGTQKCVDDPVMPSACIVARRRFRFLAHTQRGIPIRVDSRCAGKRCEKETDTCIDGTCVDAFVPDGADAPVASGPPPTDGGADGDGAEPPDAADATVATGCTGLGDGVVVPDVGPGTDMIAVNSTTVFWMQAAGVAANVRAAPKGGASSAPTAFYSAASGDVQAIAADDRAVFVATRSGLLRFSATDLSKAPEVLLAGSLVHDLAMRNGALYALATESVSGSVMVYQLIDGTAPLPIAEGPAGATQLAVGTSFLWVLTPPFSLLHRIDVSTVDSPKTAVLPVSPAAYHIAAFPGAVGLVEAGYVTRDQQSGTPVITRVEVTGATPTAKTLAQAPSPGRLAVDGTNVFLVRNTPNSAVVVRTAIDTASPTTVPEPIEARSYGALKGMTVDPAPDGCVYFTASQAGAAAGGVFALRSAPKALPAKGDGGKSPGGSSGP